MKTVQVCYTILHTFEVPDDMDETDIRFMVTDYAEDNGFKYEIHEWNAEVYQDGRIIDNFCQEE